MPQSPLAKVRLYELPGANETPRVLSFVESDSEQIPFAIKRMYWLHDLAPGVKRGHHGHRCLRQVMICMTGEVIVTIRDGVQSVSYRLDSASQGLYLPAGLWREIETPTTVSSASTLVNLASEHFSEADYIRNFDDYCNWAAETEWGRKR